MTNGAFLGKIQHLDYETKKIQLGAGDSLFLYTDGVSEAMNSAMNMYQEERLEAYLKTAFDASITDMVRGSIADIRKHTLDAPQSDDITVLTLRYFGKNGR
jgi:sigma-B regulation protein RsbU (phosphoserine phosphatase)